MTYGCETRRSLIRLTILASISVPNEKSALDNLAMRRNIVSCRSNSVSPSSIGSHTVSSTTFLAVAIEEVLQVLATLFSHSKTQFSTQAVKYTLCFSDTLFQPSLRRRRVLLLYETVLLRSRPQLWFPLNPLALLETGRIKFVYHAKRT